MPATSELAQAREKTTPHDSAPGVRAVLIPAVEERPPAEVMIDELESIQRLVGGDIQAIPFDGEPRTTVYIDEEGKIKGCRRNPCAQRLLGPGLLPGDYLVGNVVVAGFDLDTGANEDLTRQLRERLLAPGALNACKLRAPDHTAESGRSRLYEWLVGAPDDEGVQSMMVLAINHNTNRHALTAYVDNETIRPLPRSGRRLRTLSMGTGCTIARLEIARYSRKRRDEFAEQALNRLGKLFEAGENRITALIDDPACTARRQSSPPDNTQTHSKSAQDPSREVTA
jgi:hypothetical protein